MTRRHIWNFLCAALAMLPWLLVVCLPLACVASWWIGSGSEPPEQVRVTEALVRSLVLAAVIGMAAVVLGWIPGRVLGMCTRGRDVLLLALLMPLVLPRYVLHYAWTLVLSPTTSLGRFLASKPDVAQWIGLVVSVFVMICWYWPLAALLLAQGWRNIDARIWDIASLDARGSQWWRRITMPLMWRTAVLAFMVCFVMSLAEFGTFHLAGVQTVGTELAVLYELTGSAGAVARAAWPLAVIAMIAAIVIGRVSREWESHTVPIAENHRAGSFFMWGCVVALVVLSVGGPVVILVYNMQGTTELQRFLTLHADDLAWSGIVAAVAAVLSCAIAMSIIRRNNRFRREGKERRRVAGALATAMRATVFTAMFLPASVMAVSLLSMVHHLGAADWLRDSWLLVSAGQAGRFGGIALVVLSFAQSSHDKFLSEMAALDGASAWRTWLHVHLPRTWPLYAGVFLLLILFSLTELSATMVLLPAGVPNFAQRLLNQMHYARDQQVIASCLVLIIFFVLFSGVIVLLLRLGRSRHIHAILIVAFGAVAISGCDKGVPEEAEVLHHFGRSGRGQCEFIYPRGIDIAADGLLYVVDKTGRIQKFTPEGDFLSVVQMPRVEKGLPTGLSTARDGRLFVADTHYHRVVVFSVDGDLLGEFGRFGQDDGCFIYPTDIAFAPDGRIFVSEYGGNDRISIFDGDGQFISSFGSPGSGEAQFSRPSAVCVDDVRKCLYIADACNHRIAVYDLQGGLLRYIGEPGREQGQLRYPYDLSLQANGTIVVCEYGNNRIQLFDPSGESLGACGSAGRQLGQLAYPWGVAVRGNRAFIVDAGNDRIQVWRL